MARIETDPTTGVIRISWKKGEDIKSEIKKAFEQEEVPAKEIFGNSKSKQKSKITDHILVMGKAQDSDGKKTKVENLEWDDLAKLTKNTSQKLSEFPSTHNYELATLKVFISQKGLDGDLLEFKQQLEWAEE